MVKRGKDGRKLKAVITLLASGGTLPPENKDHALKGNFKGCRDCHIEPDWLLIYRRGYDALYLERTGSYADLFE